MALLWACLLFLLAMMTRISMDDVSSGHIHCVNADKGGPFAVEIDWEINDDVICFTLSSKCSSCWLGLGLNTQGKRPNEMGDADFYVATFTDPGPGAFLSVTDRYLNSLTPGEPTEDTDTFSSCLYNAIVPPFTASQTDGLTSFSFCRLLSTGDAKCDHDINPNISMVVLCAHDLSNEFGFHGEENYGFVSNYFFRGVVVYNDTDSTGLPEENQYQSFIVWHGCMMFLAFGILFPFGIFVARFLKSFWWWFPLHIAIQVLSLAISAIAFILIVLETDEEVSFTFWHSYIGLAALILVWISPFLGLISHFMWDPNRSSVPVFPDQVHWNVGRLAILVGFAAIYLGIYRLEEVYSEGSLIIAYVFSILLVFYITSFLTVDFAQRFKDQQGYDTIQ